MMTDTRWSLSDRHLQSNVLQAIDLVNIFSLLQWFLLGLCKLSSILSMFSLTFSALWSLRHLNSSIFLWSIFQLMFDEDENEFKNEGIKDRLQSCFVFVFRESPLLLSDQFSSVWRYRLSLSLSLRNSIRQWKNRLETTILISTIIWTMIKQNSFGWDTSLQASVLVSSVERAQRRSIVFEHSSKVGQVLCWSVVRSFSSSLRFG